MQFTYGNTYEHVPDADKVFPDDSDSKLRYEHNWSMFLILTKDKSQTHKYVKSITYHIPLIYVENGEVTTDYKRVKEVKVEEAPFKLERETFIGFYVTL